MARQPQKCPKGLTPWSDTEDDRIRARYAAGYYPSEIVGEFPGRSSDAIRIHAANIGLHCDPAARRARLAREKAGVVPETPDAPPPDDTSLASPLRTRPVTLDELLETFHLDPAAWDVVECTPNVWQIGAKHPETGEILTAPLYQLKARLKRKAPASMEHLKAALLADIAADTVQRTRLRFKAPAFTDETEPHALEVLLFDVHLGKLAWGEETGHANYDSAIAERMARAAVDDLLACARPYPIEKVILPIGNDLLHVDNLLGQTNAGTRQDVDSRYHLMFRRARSLVSWMIERCAQIAPVEVVVVPGNHDTVSAWTVGEVLAAEWKNDPRVTFQGSPKSRKYVVYGGNLIGYTHGDKEPIKKLPSIMSTERKHDWAATWVREWHIGHRHKSQVVAPIYVDDHEGVTVRTIRALSGTDAWHADQGYVGTLRGAEAFVWRKSGGIRALFNHTVNEDAAA